MSGFYLIPPIQDVILWKNSHILYPFQYRSNFPAGLKENAVFVDLALKFHQRAEEILEKQLELVIFSLNEVIIWSVC